MMGHVLITGGGSGLGLATAEAMGKTHRVSIIGRRGAVAEAAASALPEAAAFAADVTDEAALTTAVRAAEERFGPVNVLVAAAGVSETAPIARTETDMLRTLFRVNVEGVLNAIRPVLPSMIDAGRGRVIAIASTAGLKGYAYAGAYAATKHAVLGLIRSLALETAKTGVTANAVCPGFANTDMTTASIERIMKKTGRSEAEARAALCSTSPMGRLVEPQEVADTVRWLAGPAAAAITGQAIAVAGGEVM
ncbi:MAG: SDR family NAD(P)-dependent oxidoreductase [Pseudomonadota bacterium]